MTVAVCLHCGEFKIGAWGVCSRCGTAPETAEHMAGALAFTDHYLTLEQLTQASKQIIAGQPIELDPDFYEQLLAGIRAEGLGGPKRPPWWKFW